jgi:hypothetical protein
MAAASTSTATPMEIVHEHNLSKPLDVAKPYGIRVSLPVRDTFTRLLGSGWQQHHWFATREERDRTLTDMASEHLYPAARSSHRAVRACGARTPPASSRFIKA